MNCSVKHPQSVDSFFRHADPSFAGETRCNGLSCHLARRANHRQDYTDTDSLRWVSCLGYCYDSPVILDQDKRNIGEASGSLLSGPDIHCLSSLPVVTERISKGSFSDINTARSAGVYLVFEETLRQSPDAVLEKVLSSGEQGRGGAGFPTGKKWQVCASIPADQKYIVANGDEGDPGSFVDRVLLESDPHAILEGLLICAHVVGASRGFVYIRAEYPNAITQMQQAIRQARQAGLLGDNLFGTSFSCDIQVVTGKGSYVCGEETALINAIEGTRGEARLRPPYPVESGLWGKPTVVNNVETLVNVPWILKHGPDAFRRLGTASSPGTKAFCLNAGFQRPGIIEAEFGVSLDTIIRAGFDSKQTQTEFPKAVLLGGPMGSVLLPHQWQVPVDYDELRVRDIRLGHAGLVALPDLSQVGDVLLHLLEFMVSESCGACAPCSLGAHQAGRLAKKYLDQRKDQDKADLVRLLTLMEQTSLCGFGQNIPKPISTLLEIWSAAHGDVQ